MDSTKFKEIFSQDIYQLPIRWDGKDFYATLYKHLKEYREDIEKKCENPDLCAEVKTVCRGLCAAVDFSLRGYPGKAYKSLEGVMEILGKDPLLIDKETIEKENLYRVVDVGNAAVPKRQRIFHVPFSMRSRMSTQRYSISGFPCLYLGTSLELCCMELAKEPQRDYLCVSRYQLQTDKRMLNRFFGEDQSPVFDNDEFRIFDISIKPDTAIKKICHDDIDIKKFIQKYIKWYPLLSACSYVRALRDAPYSAEYIIPQLFIQWVRSEDEDAVVGIKYFSCASGYASILGNNYVFPTMGTPYHARKTISDYCARLSHRFKLTAPRFIMEYKSIADCINEIQKDDLDYIEGYDAGEDEEIQGDYTVPEGVSAIGAFAFSGCRSLRSITIPDSVTSIGDYAFYGCRSLTNITIPESVTSIGDSAFFGCSSLRSINVPDGVTGIGKSVFSGCRSLTSITIPGSVTNIDDSAFFGCSSLRSINVPDGVTGIGKSGFSGCCSLKSITIPGSVTSIGELAFFDCSSLKSINVPDGVTSIGDYAFSYCRSLTSITIPDSVTIIGKFTFRNCSSLTEIRVNSSNECYTSVGGILYHKNKTKLLCYPAGKNQTSFAVPSDVTSIDDNAFSGCSLLTSITIPDSVTNIGKSGFSGCRSLTSITIPSSVTSIDELAFYRCRSLRSITIPDSVTSIGEFVFSGCRSLDTVYYSGTQEQAEKLNIGKGNEFLRNATWVYGSSGAES